MNPYICFILGFLFKIVASDDYDQSNRLNFGSVIFKYQDLGKHSWSKRKIGLLYARMFSQNIIEYLNKLDVHDENYIGDHFSFFQDAYETLERQARDTDAKVILMTALSDTIGGYLKVKVLPVTKYAYYAGSIPYSSIAGVYDFYHDIKRQLKTNGEGWQKPQRSILQSIHISDINTAAHNTFIRDIRNLKDPCQQLAYYEKHPKIGLTAPIPKIRWARNATTLFVPFQKQTLFPMTYPKCSNELFKYFIIATLCLKSKYTPNEPAVKDFEQRYQSWLNHDVVPHLHEENLYPGLGGILVLVACVNNNEYFVPGPEPHVPKKIIKPSKKTSFMATNFHDHSKKILIILILLIVEIMWCVPALACAWTWRHRSNSSEYSSTQKGSSNICNLFHKSRQSAGPLDVLFRNKDSKNNQTTTGSSQTEPTSCSSLFQCSNIVDSTSNSHTHGNEKCTNSKGIQINNSNKPSLKEVSCDITIDHLEKCTMKAYPSKSSKRNDENTMKELSAQSMVVILEKETKKKRSSNLLRLKNQEVMQEASISTRATLSRPETDYKSCHCVTARESLETTVPHTRPPRRKQRSTSIDTHQDSSVTLSRYPKVPSIPKISTSAATFESPENVKALSNKVLGLSSSIARKSSSSRTIGSNTTLADSASCCRTEIAIPEEVTYECINERKKIKRNKKTTTFSNEVTKLPGIDIKDTSNKSINNAKVGVIGTYALPDTEIKDSNQDNGNNDVTTSFYMENVKDPSQQDDNKIAPHPSKAPNHDITVSLNIELIKRQGKRSKIPKLSISPIPINKKEKCGTKNETKIIPGDLRKQHCHIPILRLRRVSDVSQIQLKEENKKKNKLNVTL